MKHPVEGKIRKNRWLTPTLFELEIDFPTISQPIFPGQFVELECKGKAPVFLNRPFSPFRIQNDTWTFIIQYKGKGTSNLSELRAGDTIRMLSPLGKPFPGLDQHRRVLLIAGGVGIIPLHFYLSRILVQPSETTISLVYGTTREEDRIDLSGLPFHVQVLYHADQSNKEENTNLFQFYLQLPSISFDTALICGPLAMMKAFSRHFTKENKLHFVSMEIMMACGLGFCKGCSISTSEGMKSVCSDGPVFNGTLLDWNLL